MQLTDSPKHTITEASMGTIESRLAALEKLYADKSLELATCRLDVSVLQDLFIIWQRIVTGEDASALEGLVEKLLPSEPTSAAARQLLGLPVKEVRMQEDEPEDGTDPFSNRPPRGTRVVSIISKSVGTVVAREQGRAWVSIDQGPTKPPRLECWAWYEIQVAKPEPKQREYPALRWVSGRDIGGGYPQNNWYARLGPWHIGWILKDGRMASLDLVDGCTSGGFVDESEARLWLESKFCEWFDSLFDQPQ